LKFVFIDGNDTIELVNELLAVLTPMNKTIAIAFFKKHLPWGWLEEGQRFDKKFDEGKRYGKKWDDTIAFLEDPANDIWSWAKANLVTQFIVPNYQKMITNAVSNAMAGKKNPDTGEREGAISAVTILEAVVAGGVSADDLLEVFSNIEERQEKKEQAA
jgi:hypothetical protein